MGLHPLTPAKQSTTTTPPSPQQHYAQLLGLEATHLRRGEKDGEGKGRDQLVQWGEKTATEVHGRKGFYCGYVSSDVWQRDVELHIFSVHSCFISLFYSTTALQFLL